MFFLSGGKGAAREWLQGSRASTAALSVPGRLAKTLPESSPAVLFSETRLKEC